MKFLSLTVPLLSGGSCCAVTIVKGTEGNVVHVPILIRQTLAWLHVFYTLEYDTSFCSFHRLLCSLHDCRFKDWSWTCSLLKKLSGVQNERQCFLLNNKSSPFFWSWVTFWSEAAQTPDLKCHTERKQNNLGTIRSLVWPNSAMTYTAVQEIRADCMSNNLEFYKTVIIHEKLTVTGVHREQ